jgi:hypothetical protein
MAKTSTPTRDTQTKVAAALIPRATDPRSELFWLLGRIEGQGVEGAARIVTLVIELTAPPTAEGETQETE